MPERSKQSANQRDPDEDKPRHRPGEGLDKSDEAVVEAAREHPRPEPETDRQDRRTIDTRRSG